jgi:hypothetical protein
MKLKKMFIKGANKNHLEIAKDIEREYRLKKGLSAATKRPASQKNDGART